MRIYKRSVAKKKKKRGKRKVEKSTHGCFRAAAFLWLLYSPICYIYARGFVVLCYIINKNVPMFQLGKQYDRNPFFSPRRVCLSPSTRW